MNGIRKTVGKTTIMYVIAYLLVEVGKSFKKVGRSFIELPEMERFINTLYSLSNVGRYDAAIAVGGVMYPLDLFKVDSRFAEAFVQPRAVTMPGSSPFSKDVITHPSNDVIMSPAEMIEFQYKFFSMFKLQPQLEDVTQFIRVISLSEVVNCGNGTKYHVEDLATVKSVPCDLTITEQLFEEPYFNYEIEDVIRMVVTNFYSSLK